MVLHLGRTVWGRLMVCWVVAAKEEERFFGSLDVIGSQDDIWSNASQPQHTCVAATNI